MLESIFLILTRQISLSRLLFPLLISLPCYAQLDFEGFYRARGSFFKALSRSRQIKVLMQEFPEPFYAPSLKTDPLVEYEDQLFLFNQTLYLKGDYYHNQFFDVHGGLRSSAFKIKGPRAGGTLKEQDLYQLYGYINWNFNLEVRLQAGRIFYDFHIPQMVSINNYELYPYVFDGFIFGYQTEFLALDLWFANVSQLQWSFTNIKKNRNQNLGAGLSLDLRFRHSIVKRAHLNTSVFFNSDSNTTAFSYLNFNNSKSGDFWDIKDTRTSLSAEGTLGRLGYFLLVSGHGDKNFNFKFNNQSRHIEFVYSKSNWFGSSFFGGYHKDSKDYKPWLYDRHSQAGLSDLFEWGNLNYFFFGHKASVPHWFNFEIQALWFLATESGFVTLGRYGQLAFNEDVLEVKSNSIADPMALEIDIKIEKEFTENFTMSFLAGISAGVDLKRFFSHTHSQVTGIYRF